MVPIEVCHGKTTTNTDLIQAQSLEDERFEFNLRPFATRLKALLRGRRSDESGQKNARVKCHLGGERRGEGKGRITEEGQGAVGVEETLKRGV